MSHDLLAQFEIVDRAEEARRTNVERDEAILGGRGGRGVDGISDSLNPFNQPDLHSQVSGMQDVLKPIQEFPIFRRAELQCSSGPGVTQFTVTNHLASMVIVGNVILRFPVTNPRSIEQIELKPRESERIHRIFQDPMAHHLIICLESRDCMYVGRSRSGKRAIPRLLPKVKGHLIESIAWNKVEQTEQTTGPILMGTNNGVILETDIDFQDSLLPKKKAYMQEVYKLMYDLAEHSEPVTGLHMEPFPQQSYGSDIKYFILATTPKRVYQFIGTVTKGETPQFVQLFATYNTVPVQFLEIPGTLRESQLQLWPSKPNTTPLSFAWLTGAGIYYGQLGFGDQTPGESLFVEKTLIPYSHPSTSSPPIGMALTQFHCVLLYRDRAEAVCVLNQERVFEDIYNIRRDGALHALCMDPVELKMYSYQKHKVWTYTPFNEARDIWKIYLEQENYEMAKRYALGNREHMDIVLVSQAEHYFHQQRYQDAALTFSQSQLSFEEVALKFLQVNRKDALKIFLLKKLESLASSDNTQQTMLTTWLIELFLNDLGALTDEGDRDGHAKMTQEFHHFLETKNLRECLEANAKTVYDLLSSHGAVEDMVFFAMLMKDYERVITHHIRQEKYIEALRVLRNKGSEALETPEKERAGRFKRFSNLFYKFSPVLMRQCPKETVDAWKAMKRYLKPRNLIPALVQCNQPVDRAQLEASISYLEFCVNKLKNEDRAIHNFLISTYVMSQSEQKLLAYLTEQSKLIMVVYDPQYALRLCTEHKLSRACVLIYAAMGLFEESVDQALVVDVELARQIAGSKLRDEEMQKKLWLKVAQHVIRKENNIEKAMKFLKECSILKIEDILPFFPDFVTIDHFKDAICTSLSEYNAHIEELKQEMQGATDSAKNIRADIQEIRNKYVVVNSDTTCELCGSRLLVQGFFMFPCHHAFHKDCLIPEVMRYMTPEERLELERLLSDDGSVSKEGGASLAMARSSSKARIDSILGSQCLYCGDIMIASVSQPLTPADSLEKELSSWK